MEVSCSLRKLTLLVVAAFILAPAPAFAAEQPPNAEHDALIQHEIDSGLEYAAKLKSQAAQYNELAASADTYAKQASNPKDKADWEQTARGHRESADKLMQRAAEEERKANALKKETPTPTAPPTSTHTPTPTATHTPTATSTPTPTPTTAPTTPPASGAPNTSAATPTNVPFDFPVESAIGEWFVAGTKEMVVIDPRYPDSETERYKLVARTSDRTRNWNGTFTSFNAGDISRSQNARLVFRYKPRAAEMNTDMPDWVRQYLEEKLEWVLELGEAPPPDNPTLVGRWYAGEVKWEEQENGRVDIIGRGKPRDVTLERECVFKDAAAPRSRFSLPAVANLPGPTTKAWSDTALDFLAIFNVNGIGEVMLDRFHEAGGHFDVIQGSGTSSTDSRYNTDDDVIKLGKGAIKANGVIDKQQPRGNVAVYTHEFMHAYIDQVVQPGYDPTTAQIFAQGANWIGQQKLQEASKEGAAMPNAPLQAGNGVLDTNKKRADFFEEYTGFVINRMVGEHLRITKQLTDKEINAAEAEQAWRCFLSKLSREKMIAYEDADSPMHQVNAGPPAFLTDYLADLLGLGYPRPK